MDIIVLKTFLPDNIWHRLDLSFKESKNVDAVLSFYSIKLELETMQKIRDQLQARIEEREREQ